MLVEALVAFAASTGILPLLSLVTPWRLRKGPAPGTSASRLDTIGTIPRTVPTPMANGIVLLLEEGNTHICTCK